MKLHSHPSKASSHPTGTIQRSRAQEEHPQWAPAIFQTLTRLVADNTRRNALEVVANSTHLQLLECDCFAKHMGSKFVTRDANNIVSGRRE